MDTAENETLDAGGMTQAEVEQLTLKDQFDLYGERYSHVQELLTGAQLQISDDVWGWGGEAFGPSSGALGPNALPGADFENSYFLKTSRSIRLPGSTGAREDLDPMIAYFESQNWDTSVASEGSDYAVSADTGDGYQVGYTVRPNGQYNVEVYSYVFWGDFDALHEATLGRYHLDMTIPSETVPGEFVAYPKWSDPLIPTE